MNKYVKRTLHVSIGIIAGLFLGATLGQILGATIGGIIDIFYQNTLHISEIIIGGFLGLVCGAIIGAGLLSLGKLLLSLTERLKFVITTCAISGLLVGALVGFALPEMTNSLNFIVFVGSVGLWVGIIVGSFAGIWLSLKASKKEIIVSDEEKMVDTGYAQFLREKARHK